MPIGVRRLNRRRYRESVVALKEIIGDKKTPPQRKIRAIEMLLSIYDRHDRNEERKAAQKRAVGASQDAGQPEGSPEAQERAQESVEEFLARIAARHTEEIETDE